MPTIAYILTTDHCFFFCIIRNIIMKKQSRRIILLVKNQRITTKFYLGIRNQIYMINPLMLNL